MVSICHRVLCENARIFIIYSDLVAIVRTVETRKPMQYLYYFANTSLVVRLLTYLAKQVPFNLESVTVIYLVDRWVMRIKLKTLLPHKQHLNFKSFLNENGYEYTPATVITQALCGLDQGLCATEVMNRHHVVVVSHGAINPADIEDFRVTFVRGLGYCPPSLV